MAGISLIALALGYKVYVDAGKEKEGAKILGQAIGVFVMIAAVLVTLMGFCPKYRHGKTGWNCAEKDRTTVDCPMKKKTCPISAPSAQ